MNLFYFLFILSIIFISCRRSDSENNQETSFTDILSGEEDNSNIKSSTPTHCIPIHINLAHPTELTENSDMQYQIKKGKNSIIIYPTSYNFDGFNSGERYMVRNHGYFDSTEDVECICLEAIITNDTDVPISVDKLIFEVEDSHIDPAPYLYICTVEDTPNTIIISDEGWTDYGGFTLEYSLMKKGEKFNGKYTHKRKLARPADFLEIDFTEDMKKMGYNWDYLNSNFKDQNNKYLFVSSDNYPGNPEKLFYPFEWSVIDYEYTNIYIGFCRLYGKISFERGHKPVEFMANLQLSTEGGFGGYLSDSDHFDVELFTNKANYKVVKPYHTTLQPQSTEKVSINMGCPKSSYHKFIIRATNDTDIDIISLPISFHYMMPRHSSKCETGWSETNT